MNEGGQPNRVAVPDVQTRENVGSSKDDSDQTKSRSDIPVTPSEIEIEGSYAKALRKAYAEEPNAKIKAALAAEYEEWILDNDEWGFLYLNNLSDYLNQLD